MFDFDLSKVERILPDRVEYARIGCRLLVDHDRLTVEGTHGVEGRTMLTIKVLGQKLGLIKQPERTYQLTDLIATARERLAGYDVDGILRWWGGRQADRHQGD
jgi:hypothetical protein